VRRFSPRRISLLVSSQVLLEKKEKNQMMSACVPKRKQISSSVLELDR
jgi:hypothetical protein